MLGARGGGAVDLWFENGGTKTLGFQDLKKSSHSVQNVLAPGSAIPLETPHHSL